MNSKIIFWMNDDLSGLGLPKILQEKYNFQVFGIFDITDKPKKFFKKQKLINFSKIWFFHDHINKTNQKSNREFLKLIEEKYKVNLSLLASNERFFNEFNHYYKFSSDEKLLIIEQECRFFERVLDEVKPDFLIMGITTLHHNHLFYKICKTRGIRILMIRPSFLAGKYIIADAIDTFENSSYKQKHNFSSLQQLQNYLKKYDSTNQARLVRNRFQSSKINYLKAIFRYLFSSNTNVKTHYTYYGRTKFAVIKEMFFYTVKKKLRGYFVNKNLIYDIEFKKPFIYFPLQIEQERSLLIAAPLYTNQLEVITNILKSLPDGYDLYLKEHPMMILRGWRSTSVYRQIMSLPNVKLIHPSIKSENVIEKASLVISVSSTSSLEAAFFNKPSIIFADVDYLSLPSIHKIKTIDELPDTIQTALKKQVNVSDLNNYLNLVEANSFEIDLLNLSTVFDNYFHYTGFLMDTEIPIEKMKLFLDQHHETFEKLATQIVNKIQNVKTDN